MNERDFMGVLLGSNRHSKALRASEVDSNLALIENLKKSMREYLFDKKFKKMTEKLKRINRELDRKDEDYSPKIDDCLQVTNSCAVFSRNRDDRHLEFYVDLHQQLNAKV